MPELWILLSFYSLNTDISTFNARYAHAHTLNTHVYSICRKLEYLYLTPRPLPVFFANAVCFVVSTVPLPV